MILPELMAALKKGDLGQAIALVRNWLATAKPGEPEALLARCPTELRGRVALLLRDLLSRYPATLVGAPVLLYCVPDSDNESSDCLPPADQALPKLRLPFPSRKLSQPCSDLHFLGWLSKDALMPIGLPFQPAQHAVEIPQRQPVAAVALFRSHPGVFDLDSLTLPDLWWAEVFMALAGQTRLSARMLLPYPDALEAARVLHASARGEHLPCRGGFLSDNAWAWASDAGALFQESCRHWYPATQ